MSSNLLAAYRHALANQREIEASTQCGCFHCVQTFPPEEIVAWTGGWDPTSGQDPDEADPATALCPRCGSESVIGDRSGFAITPEFLGRMNEAWFQRTIIRRPAPKA